MFFNKGLTLLFFLFISLLATAQTITLLTGTILHFKEQYALHVGAIYGGYTKIFYFLASLICATLPVTGFYIWWGKKKKQRK